LPSECKVIEKSSEVISRAELEKPRKRDKYNKNGVLKGWESRVQVSLPLLERSPKGTEFISGFGLFLLPGNKGWNKLLG